MRLIMRIVLFCLSISYVHKALSSSPEGEWVELKPIDFSQAGVGNDLLTVFNNPVRWKKEKHQIIKHITENLHYTTWEVGSFLANIKVTSQNRSEVISLLNKVFEAADKSKSTIEFDGQTIEVDPRKDILINMVGKLTIGSTINLSDRELSEKLDFLEDFSLVSALEDKMQSPLSHPCMAAGNIGSANELKRLETIYSRIPGGTSAVLCPNLDGINNETLADRIKTQEKYISGELKRPVFNVEPIHTLLSEEGKANKEQTTKKASLRDLKEVFQSNEKRYYLIRSSGRFFSLTLENSKGCRKDDLAERFKEFEKQIALSVNRCKDLQQNFPDLLTVNPSLGNLFRSKPNGTCNAWASIREISPLEKALYNVVNLDQDKKGLSFETGMKVWDITPKELENINVKTLLSVSDAVQKPKSKLRSVGRQPAEKAPVETIP